MWAYICLYITISLLKMIIDLASQRSFQFLFCDLPIEHQNLFNIPQELLDMTLYELLDAVFISGVLQPADFPSFDGPD